MADEEQQTPDDEVDLVAFVELVEQIQTGALPRHQSCAAGARRAVTRSVEAEARDILAEAPDREPVSIGEV